MPGPDDPDELSRLRHLGLHNMGSIYTSIISPKVHKYEGSYDKKSIGPKAGTFPTVKIIPGIE